MTEVLILCGGRGTRLKTISKGTPKPLVRFPTDNSYSILEQIIFRLKLVGLNSFTLVVNSINYSIYKQNLEYLKSQTNCSISLLCDPKGLSGTAAWLFSYMPRSDDLLIVNGDTYYKGNIFNFINSNCGALISVAPSDRNDAGNIQVDQLNKRVLTFLEKAPIDASESSCDSLIYSGLFKLSLSLFDRLRAHFASHQHTISLEYDIFPWLIKQHLLYASTQPIVPFDIGTVERFTSLSLSHPNGFTNPIVFWDRDSTLNYDSGYTYRLDSFKFCDDKLELMNKFSSAGFSHVIITNQSGIGRNYYTESDFHDFNQLIMDYLLERDIYISDIFWCPHVPTPEGMPTCNCRKPGTKLFTSALTKYNGSYTDSLSIGDKLTDIEPASKLGFSGVLLPISSSFRFQI